MPLHRRSRDWREQEVEPYELLAKSIGTNMSSHLTISLSTEETAAVSDPVEEDALELKAN
jgi:hypothetical protein